MTTPYPGLGNVINSTKTPTKTIGGTQYEEYTQGSKGSASGNEGNGILSTLALPNGLDPWKTFTWDTNVGAPANAQISGPFQPGHNPNKTTLTQMTVAGAMSWLRQLAVNNGTNGGQYDAIVHQLLAAGYITSADKARYGSFTTDVGNAFLKSIADVWNINTATDEGQLIKWGDHINAMIAARKAAGQIDPTTELPISGSGGGSVGPQAPTRTDTYTNPDDVKKAINDAARNILGRHLTDAEAASFQSLFHAKEKTANDQQWAQQLASFNNGTTPNKAPDATQAPSASGEAQTYMDGSPAFGQERTTQLLGSYLGVLRSMVGMGGGGVANAVS